MRLTTIIIACILSFTLSGQDALMEAYQSEDYPLALRLAKECIELDSNNYQCYEKAGLAAFRLGNFLECKNALLKAEEIQPENKLVLKQLASVYEQEENVPKAIKYYNQLLKQDSLNAVYTRKLGQLFMKADMMHDAFPYFAKAYSLNANDFYTIKGMVEILTTNKQYELADSILTEALIVDSTNIQFTLLSARSAYIQKKYNKTIEQIESLRGRLDLNNYYNKMTGFSYLQVDSLDRAIFHLSKSLVDEPRPEHASYYLGIAYEKKGEPELALEYYEKALMAGISKDTDLYHRQLAKLHKEKNQLKKAIHHYTEATKYDDDPLLWFLLAQVCDDYYKDKNIAIRYYKKFSDSDHENKSYKKYARERSMYLKEQVHLSSK